MCGKISMVCISDDLGTSRPGTIPKSPNFTYSVSISGTSTEHSYSATADKSCQENQNYCRLFPYRGSALLGGRFTGHIVEFTGRIIQLCFTGALCILHFWSIQSYRQLSVAGSGRATPAKESPYPLDRKLSGPQNHSGKSMQEKMSCR
jgi:hypothetical protein